MYFSVGWPQKLTNLSQLHCEDIISVNANNSRQLLAVVFENTVSIWSVKPEGELFSLRRSDESIRKFGTNVSVLWKLDSSVLVLTTSSGFMVFYSVFEDVNKHGRNVFVRTEFRNVGTQNDQVEMSWGESINAVQLKESARIKVLGNIKSMTCFREEVFVATAIGLLYRVRWDGKFQTEMTTPVNSIAFSADLQQSRVVLLNDPDLHIVDIKYSSAIGGFATVMSNGRLGFITAASIKYDQNQMIGVLAPDINNATTVAVNNRYRLIACGCSSGEGAVYTIDDMTGAFQLTHKLALSVKEFPDCGVQCGSVSKILWSPDGTVLAMVWQKCGFALWSVFGSLIHHSLVNDLGAHGSEDIFSCHKIKISSLDWSAEGYQIWMICCNGASQSNKKLQQDIYIVNFVKSALTINPCRANHDHLILQGDDRIYLYPTEPLTQYANASFAEEGTESPTVLLGNRQWQVILLSQAYLQHNWPIRMVAVDQLGLYIAVAGKFGLAFFSRHSQRWKLFGNESQERDMIVTGGLLWWEDFVCTSCFNAREHKDEIRFYPRDCKLDNAFSSIFRIPSQIVLLNIFCNLLVALCIDSHIMLFDISRSSTHNFSIILSKIQEVAIGHYIPHPIHVTGLFLSSIRTETISKHLTESGEAESMLLNMAGRVLLFQRDRSGPQVKQKDKEKPLPFCSPTGVASNVENMWLCMPQNDEKLDLSEVLWLNCGAAGMKVWLPLQHKEASRASHFLSRRIMLPFNCDIVPLALLFNAGVILGVTSEALSIKAGKDYEQLWPYRQLQRTSQVFLHHIVRQLLRRNLGSAALEVARCYRDLPYFPHVLELLLHEILEEEATSKEPIPDPLLPRVVAFIHEFPEYLQVVVHCSRKTEVALWDHLFSIVGNPKDLFEECLIYGQLKSAASYLIILQNLEKPFVARQHAILLLDAALEKYEWNLVRDLLRFLRAIDPSEEEILCQSNKTKKSSYPSALTTPPQTPSDAVLLAPLRNFAINREESKENTSKSKSKIIRMDSVGRKRSPSGIAIEDGNTDELYVDVILTRHARRLLSEYRLRDLACFAANLNDYQLVGWMKKEKNKTSHVEDFTCALKRLHSDFTWPFPILSLTTLRKINSDSVLNVKINEIHSWNIESSVEETEQESVNSLVQYNQLDEANDSSSVVTSIFLLQKDSRQQSDKCMKLSANVSEASSGIGDIETTDSAWSTDTLHVEQISQELSNRGSRQSEMELRYLLHIVLEAGYFEWAILLAIVLRDTAVLVHILSVARLSDISAEIISKLKVGITALQTWANVECIGYKPFLESVDKEIAALEKLPNNSQIQLSMMKKSSTMSLPADQLYSSFQSLKSPIGTPLLTDALISNAKLSCPQPSVPKITKSNEKSEENLSKQQSISECIIS